MKFTLFYLRAATAIAGVGALTGGVGAAPVLTEAFDYAAGNLTSVSSGAWAAHSAAGANPIQVATTSPPSVSTVPALGGNYATFTNGSITGGREDINRQLTGYTGTDGTSLYASFVFRVDSIPATTSADAVFHFFNTSSVWPLRVYLKPSADGTSYQLGVRPQNNTAIVYATNALVPGTSYHIAAGLDLVAGAGDVASLWISPALGQASPSTPDATQTESGTETVPTHIAIRQGANLTDSTMSIDDIRVSASWADVTPAKASVRDWTLY